MAQKPRRPLTPRLVAGLAATAALIGGLTAPPAAAVMHGGVDVRTHTWKGEGRALHDGDRVRVAGKPFNNFLERRLDRLDGPDPSCDGSGTIVLKRLRSDGYAWLPQVGSGEPCSSGSSFAVAVRQDGRWSTPRALRGQVAPRCTALSSYSVPPRIFRGRCAVPDGTRVAYRDWYWNKVDDQGNPR